MLKFFCFFVVLIAVVTANRERRLMKNIANSVARAKTQQPHFYSDHVCYHDLGCFESTGPMKQTGVFPKAPEEIGTTFYAFKGGSARRRAVEHIVDPNDPSTFQVINAQKQLVIIIHGFGMSYTNGELNQIKNHLLAQTHGEVGSVIIVDWSKGAASPDYGAASSNTQVVGRQVAHLVNELRKHHGVDPLNVYLIGFSLGAQVSGYAGKYSQSEYKWKLGRITGLDAASPLFEGYPGSHLTKEDAHFVDGIHSSAGGNILLGEVGFIEPYGHLDFYPNGGKKQPHCGIFSGITCNHYGSVLFYDASLHAKSTCKFHGAPCTSWADYAAKKCSTYDAELGYWAQAMAAKTHATGLRFLSTTKKLPFCA